jgi:diguanylate cyclase (GGDEF)-like protein
MKIKTRLLVLIVAVVVILELIAIIINSSLIHEGFVNLERRLEAGNNERVVQSVINESAQLSRIARDWASWDDMYVFLVSRSPSFIRSNFTDATLVNIRVNALYCFDPAGRIVWGRTIDHQDPSRRVTPLLDRGTVPDDHPVKQILRSWSGGRGDSITGLMMSTQGPVLIAAHPVLRSDHSGPARGVLLMARLVDADFTGRLKEVTRLGFDVVDAAQIRVHPDDNALPLEYAGTGSFYRPGGEAIFYYTPLRDIQGRVIQYVVRRSDQEITKQGKRTILFAQIVLLLSSAIMLGGLLVGMYRWIATPLTRLLTRIHHIKAEGVFQGDLPVQYDDEIGHLTKEFNSMMNMIHHQTVLLEERATRLTELARVDELTRLLNRRSFDDSLRYEWQRLKRDRAHLAIIMLDIDYFKRYNDRYGHLQGDDCLRRVAQAINTAVRRPADIAARYGGEEFAIILPATDLSGALAVAQAIAGGVGSLAIPHEGSPLERVTVSMGVSECVPDEKTSGSALIAEADAALYTAKTKGRNGIEAHKRA